MKRFLAVLCCMTLCMAFAACGDVKTESSSEKVETKPAQTTMTLLPQQSQDSVIAPDSDNADKTVQEYLDENKESFDVLKESMGGTGMKLDVFARDNSLVYSYQYTFDITDIDSVKETLEQGFDTIKDSYSQTFNALSADVPSARSIVVEYLDSEGNLITTYEFL